MGLETLRESEPVSHAGRKGNKSLCTRTVHLYHVTGDRTHESKLSLVACACGPFTRLVCNGEGDADCDKGCGVGVALDIAQLE